MRRKIVLILLLLLIATPVLAVKINNPIRFNSPESLIANIIKTVLGLIGVISLIYFIMGGMMWMTAGGNMEKVKKGRDTLVWATLGLLVIFSSYTVVSTTLDILK